MNSAGTVHIVYGPQGAGKSTFSDGLASQLEAVSFSIDDWMLRLFMPDLPEQMSLDWMLERTGRCEQMIWAVCLQVLKQGTDVVLDLGLLRHSDRQRVRTLAQHAGFAARFYLIDAAQVVRRRRVLARNTAKGTTFSFVVTPAMFEFMETVYEAPGEAELLLSEQMGV